MLVTGTTGRTYDVRRVRPLNGFWEDAEKAMTDNPAYFARWYSVKSWLLVGSLATIAYMVGRRRRKK